MTEQGEPRWVFYTTASGVDVVKREISKGGLSVWEAGRLRDCMDRVLRRETLPKDVKHIGGDIYELRVRGHQRNLRLFYAAGEGGPVLLALAFVPKKDQARAPAAIDAAKTRLADSRSRSGN